MAELASNPSNESSSDPNVTSSGSGGAQAFGKSHSAKRWYEKEFPDAEELVMVQVTQIAQMGSYVKLLEYGDIEGMILLSELSRRRIRSINKLIRVGKKEAVMVLRVDKERGYIDLSKRRVSLEEVEQCEVKYNKSKQAAAIIRQVAKATGKTELELNQEITWPLYKTEFKHPLDAFKVCLDAPGTIKSKIPGCSQESWDALQKVIKLRMTPKPIKIRSSIEVSCFTYSGIEAVKTALSKGLTANEGTNMKISIRLIAPPLYVMITNALNKEKGIELLHKAIGLIKASIEENGGQLTIKEAPFATSKEDDTELATLMKTLAENNKEKDGDDPEED
eukprot:g2589.t1